MLRILLWNPEHNTDDSGFSASVPGEGESQLEVEVMEEPDDHNFNIKVGEGISSNENE